MIPLKEDVVEAYRALLGREPESDDAIRSMQISHSSVLAMVLSLQASAEYRNRQASPAVHATDEAGAAFIDTALLERFRRQVKPRSGHILDWIGTRYARKLDTRLAKAPDILEPQSLSTRDAALWTALLSSVEAAGNHFTIADIGAGWGRWTAAAARAAAVRGITDVQVRAAEAQPDLCSALRQHLTTNGVTATDASVFEGLVTSGGRKCWFPVVDATMAEHAAGAFVAGEKSRKVVYAEKSGLTLADFLAQTGRTCDFGLLDCARSVEILTSGLSSLGDHVRCLALGTGNREEEGVALQALGTAGWRLMADVPAAFGMKKGQLACISRGLQVWTAPR